MTGQWTLVISSLLPGTDHHYWDDNDESGRHTHHAYHNRTDIWVVPRLQLITQVTQMVIQIPNIDLLVIK